MRLQLSLLSVLTLGCASEPTQLPAREEFAEVCAPHFACTCDEHLYADLDACMRFHHARFAELFGAAGALGLHSDLECYLELERPGEDMCLGLSEYQQLHPYEEPREPNRCGECQPVYGEQQVGEPCTRVPAGGSDCAQGLLCMDGATGVCIDPCGPTEPGEPCWYGTSICGEGRYCDSEAEVCRQAAGPGESCFASECAEGLVCYENKYCVEPAGVDERCNVIACAEGLECLHLAEGMLCKPPPDEGEYCEGTCAEGLGCDSDNRCVRRGDVGAACSGAAGCLVELLCVEGTCEAAPGAGEACHEGNCAAGLECEDEVCVAEPARICWR
jgi:hypothetical protein